MRRRRTAGQPLRTSVRVTRVHPAADARALSLRQFPPSIPNGRGRARPTVLNPARVRHAARVARDARRRAGMASGSTRDPTIYTHLYIYRERCPAGDFFFLIALQCAWACACACPCEVMSVFPSIPCAFFRQFRAQCASFRARVTAFYCKHAAASPRRPARAVTFLTFFCLLQLELPFLTLSTTVG